MHGRALRRAGRGVRRTGGRGEAGAKAAGKTFAVRARGRGRAAGDERGGEFVTLTVFAAVLCGAGFFLVFGPMKKKIKNKVRCRVRIEGDSLTWEQFLPEKTITKVKKLNRVKRVVKTDFCYFVVFNDIGNAVICERCLLKKGTFTAFESLFAGKIREKEM